MPKKRKGRGAGAKQSPEAKAFEDATRKILKVPKAKIDQKVAEQRRKRGKWEETEG